jgi:putative nucleotide binding protein
MEDYAYILDIGTIAGGRDRREQRVAFALGDTDFKLFELVPKDNAVINIGDRVYIGKEASKRDTIDHVKRRISFTELPNMAASEIEYAVADIVKNNEARFIRFYNEAGPISLKKHLLEELPGLGKKTMNAILAERESSRGSFKGYEDLSSRLSEYQKVQSFKPEKPVVARIVLEIEDPERRRYLFVQNSQK